MGTRPSVKVTVKKPVATGPVMVDFKAAKSLKCGKNNKMVVVQIKDDTKCFQSRTFAKMINGASQGAPGVTGRPMKTLITLLTPTMKLLDAIMRQGNAGTQRMWVRFTGKKWAFPTTMKKIIKKVKVGAAKLGLKIKAGSSKVKAGAKKVGLKIKLGAKKAVAATKKFGASLSAGFKKVGASIKVGLPKVKVTAPKASLKLSVGKKSRRMQAAAAKPAVVAPAAATVNSDIKEGGVTGAKLPVSGVKVPEDIEGDGQLSAMMMKSFAAFVTAAMILLN